jgi:uncharacterized protein YbjQ (UPF0145 family)
MQITTTEEISGEKITKVLGIVNGSTVRVRNIWADICAGFKNFVGGEVDTYTEMLIDSRELAVKRMVAEAKKMGADGIVAVRFVNCNIMSGTAEILAYGTAVKLK